MRARNGSVCALRGGVLSARSTAAGRRVYVPVVTSASRGGARVSQLLDEAAFGGGCGDWPLIAS